MVERASKFFLVLATAFKQIFPTLVSTATVEQEFSASGHILDARCSYMGPESIVAHIFINDWTRAQYRQQEFVQQQQLEQELSYGVHDNQTMDGTTGSD